MQKIFYTDGRSIYFKTDYEFDLPDNLLPIELESLGMNIRYIYLNYIRLIYEK